MSQLIFRWNIPQYQFAHPSSFVIVLKQHMLGKQTHYPCTMQLLFSGIKNWKNKGLKTYYCKLMEHFPGLCWTCWKKSKCWKFWENCMIVWWNRGSVSLATKELQRYRLCLFRNMCDFIKGGMLCRKFKKHTCNEKQMSDTLY